MSIDLGLEDKYNKLKAKVGRFLASGDVDDLEEKLLVVAKLKKPEEKMMESGEYIKYRYFCGYFVVDKDEYSEVLQNQLGETPESAEEYIRDVNEMYLDAKKKKPGLDGCIYAAGLLVDELPDMPFGFMKAELEGSNMKEVKTIISEYANDYMLLLKMQGKFVGEIVVPDDSGRFVDVLLEDMEKGRLKEAERIYLQKMHNGEFREQQFVDFMMKEHVDPILACMDEARTNESRWKDVEKMYKEMVDYPYECHLAKGWLNETFGLVLKKDVFGVETRLRGLYLLMHEKYEEMAKRGYEF